MSSVRRVPTVVNLGGEGEVPGAINVNAFISPSMWNRNFAAQLDESLVIRRSAHDTGLPEGFADSVIANHFPIQYDELIIDETGSRASISILAVEIVRILKSGGGVRFACSSCDPGSLATAFRTAGLTDVVATATGTVEGRKP